MSIEQVLRLERFTEFVAIRSICSDMPVGIARPYMTFRVCPRIRVHSCDFCLQVGLNSRLNALLLLSYSLSLFVPHLLFYSFCSLTVSSLSSLYLYSLFPLKYKNLLPNTIPVINIVPQTWRKVRYCDLAAVRVGSYLYSVQVAALNLQWPTERVETP